MKGSVKIPVATAATATVTLLRSFGTWAADVLLGKVKMAAETIGVVAYSFGSDYWGGRRLVWVVASPVEKRAVKTRRRRKG